MGREERNETLYWLKVPFRFSVSTSAHTVHMSGSLMERRGDSIFILARCRRLLSEIAMLQESPNGRPPIPFDTVLQRISWKRASREDFLLPVRVLSRLYRGKFLAKLRSAERQEA